jgi:hypothetical protein
MQRREYWQYADNRVKNKNQTELVRILPTSLNFFKIAPTCPNQTKLTELFPSSTEQN